jgi:hypothetical protein
MPEEKDEGPQEVSPMKLGAKRLDTLAAREQEALADSVEVQPFKVFKPGQNTVEGEEGNVTYTDFRPQVYPSDADLPEGESDPKDSSAVESAESSTESPTTENPEKSVPIKSAGKGSTTPKESDDSSQDSSTPTNPG